MKKDNKILFLTSGFTLIELLVVIAIIGVLASIVLTSLTQSQSRAYDSKIEQQLSSFRTAAQMYFTNHGNYGPASVSCDSGMFNDVDPQDGSPGVYIATGNLPDFSIPVCTATLTQYSVKAPLYSGTEYWCVDSTGISKKVSGTPGTGTVCP